MMQKINLLTRTILKRRKTYRKRNKNSNRKKSRKELHLRNWSLLFGPFPKLTFQQKKLKQKIVLDDDFPSERVADAYLHPRVDESTEKFQWSRPDLDSLRQFARNKFGWTKELIDELLLPVMKRFDQKREVSFLVDLTSFLTTLQIQTTMTGFLQNDNKVPAKIDSERLRAAIANMTGRTTNFIQQNKPKKSKTKQPKKEKTKKQKVKDEEKKAEVTAAQAVDLSED